MIPVTEELVFRGIVFNTCKKLYPLKHAFVMSSLIYGLYHMESIQGIYGVVIGFLMAYSYEYFGNFLVPLVLRIVASVIAYMITYTPLVNTALYSAPMCILFLAVAAAAIFMIKKEKKIL